MSDHEHGSGDGSGDGLAVITYREALAWLYSFSDTERTGKFTRDREDNLARMRALLALLGDPQRAYSVSHIAGTKGKGSTATMLAAILRQTGQRVGLYTQPDLHTFRERIRVDGRLITEAEVVALLPALRAATDALDPALGSLITYDVGTALAFLAFRTLGATHAVIEVGLGGRLDATNVVEPRVTAISSISYDHTEVLGTTIAAIAREKAGIIKPGVPIVTSAQDGDAIDVITRVASERQAPLLRVGPLGAPGRAYQYQPGEATPDYQTFSLVTPTGRYDHLRINLLGEHQIENAALAVAAAEQLGAPLSEDALREGVRQARWAARLQVVGREPWVVVDGAHNADSFAHLFVALRRHFRYERLLLVVGLMADKDLSGIVREIATSEAAAVFATAVAHPRALPPDALAAAVTAASSVQAQSAPDTASALATALAAAQPRDLICVAGSLYVAGEALRWFAGQPRYAESGIEIAGVDH